MARLILKGTPVSPGIAVAELLLIRDAPIMEKRVISAEEVETEIDALEQASANVCFYLQNSMADIPEDLSEYREIIAAQMELAGDSRLLDGARARIRRRHICAAWALAETVEELCSLFQGLSDPYLSDRAQDIKLIGQAIGDSLVGIKSSHPEKRKGILATRELSLADVLELKRDGINGLLTVEGGATSHTAILARGLKVPAIIGIGDLLKEAKTGERAIIDGLSGLVLLDPDEADLKFYNSKKRNYLSFEKAATGAANLPALTRDGYTVSVSANLENPSELPSLDKSGAEGVGLYRTEFAYIGNQGLPDEEKLLREYMDVIAHVAPNRAIFRTLDLGADKLPALGLNYPEPNPALGLRGIRFSLHNKEIFRTQLRALFRAGHNANMAIMLPMVSNIREIDDTLIMIDEIKEELIKENLPHSDKIPLGVMVETPAAMMICDALADRCDFLSIGTNDLSHYLMAIDRNNRHVAYLHEPLHPAFTRSLKKIIETGHQFGKPVSVCGELASDPFMAVLLVGMGIDRLSAAPRFVPGLKHMLRQLTASDCAELTRMAINEHNVLKTRSRLYEALLASLGTELSFHNTFILDNGRHEQKTDARLNSA